MDPFALEALEFPLLLERDLELGQIEVLSVAKALQEQPVHDLGERLVSALDAPIGRDVENHGVSRNVFRDLLEQDLQLRIARATSEEGRRRLAKDLSILQR